MPRHISLLFPGQGSQSIGMLDAFTTAEKNNTLAISEDLFGWRADYRAGDSISGG